MKKGQLRQLVLSLGAGIAVFLVLAQAQIDSHPQRGAEEETPSTMSREPALA